MGNDDLLVRMEDEELGRSLALTLTLPQQCG